MRYADGSVGLRGDAAAMHTSSYEAWLAQRGAGAAKFTLLENNSTSTEGVPPPLAAAQAMVDKLVRVTVPTKQLTLEWNCHRWGVHGNYLAGARAGCSSTQVSESIVPQSTTDRPIVMSAHTGP